MPGWVLGGARDRAPRVTTAMIACAWSVVNCPGDQESGRVLAQLVLEAARAAARMIGELRYHVPRSQVWEGSRGGQTGNVHLHVTAALDAGRLHRKPGRALCGRRGWYERAPEDEHEFSESARCPRCVDLAARYGVTWP